MLTFVERQKLMDKFLEGKKMGKSGKGILDGLSDLLGDLYKDLKKEVFSKIPEWKNVVLRELMLAKKKMLDEKVTIIGPPAAGKTSLLKVLKDPNIEKSELEKYKKTESDPYTSFPVKWNVVVEEEPLRQIDFSFKVGAGIDNGGEDYIREGHWLEAMQSSGIIFYLFDFEKFNNQESFAKEKGRILKDFDWIAENVNALKANFSLIIMGNKADCFCQTLSEFRKLQKERQDTLEELYQEIMDRMPRGYSKNIKKPVLISLFDKKIRNEQFGDLMLAVMGTSLVDIIKKCNETKKEGQ